jgi:hypothetical protein
MIRSTLTPKKKTEVQNIASSQQHSIELDERLSPRYVEDWKYKNIKDPDINIQETKIDIPDKKVQIKGEGQSSRPETPTWDYYDLDLEAVDIPTFRLHRKHSQLCQNLTLSVLESSTRVVSQFLFVYFSHQKCNLEFATFPI